MRSAICERCGSPLAQLYPSLGEQELHDIRTDVEVLLAEVGAVLLERFRERPDRFLDAWLAG